MTHQLVGYDWQEAFEASRERVDPAIPGSGVSRTPISLGDVAMVLAYSEGENDSAPWLALVRAHDGRYVFVSAWCDYTGWDCQAGGSQVVGETLHSIFDYGMARSDMDALGLDWD